MTDGQVKTLGGYIIGGALIIAIALSPPWSAATNAWIDIIGGVLFVLIGLFLLVWLLWAALLRIADWMEPILSAIVRVEDAIGNKLRQFRAPLFVRVTIIAIYGVLIFSSVLYLFTPNETP